MNKICFWCEKKIKRIRREGSDSRFCSSACVYAHNLYRLNRIKNLKKEIKELEDFKKRKWK